MQCFILHILNTNLINHQETSHTYLFRKEMELNIAKIRCLLNINYKIVKNKHTRSKNSFLIFSK